ncbi:MAG: FtsW/RodA/SpoVE family cell cycle protein [Anaerolineae bacterium]|nr:FtsW/RodA/SpoVE family cell cycle protein [Anaerolineae bacterium]
MLARSTTWRYFDIWLLAAVLLLTAYGVLIIRSAVTGAPAFESLPTAQVRWAVIGIIIMFGFASIDYRVLTSMHWYIYFGLIAALVFVLVAGAFGNETRRWIQVTSEIRIQPSEFGRVFIAVTFAQFMANRRHKMHQFSNTIAAVVYIVIPVGLIFLEPDLGMSVLFWCCGL